MTLGAKTIERVSEVFLRADLGDPRRSRRAAGLAESLARAPDQSLPQVWSTPAELEAGYRFLANSHSNFTGLMGAVQHATRRRALEAQRVLVIHDTTDVTCPSAEGEDVGFLPTGKAGFFVHHALCVSANGSGPPLGMLWSHVWGREQVTRGRGNHLSAKMMANLKDRESDRWLEGVSEAQLWVGGCAEVVHVLDSEADSYRVFAHAKQLDADFVVRLRHDRRVEDSVVSECLANAATKLELLVPISKRNSKRMPSYTYQGRAARKANLQVRAVSLEVSAPRHMPRGTEPLELQVVQVLEEHPPAGEEPIAWVLATSLPIRTRADVERVVDIYRKRWLIEELHKALKTGCMLEKRQLESFEAITSLLALSYPTACELLHLRSRARQKGLPASEVLRKSQLDCLRAHPKARPLSPDPSAEEALGVIAGLGGHIKNNGPPGWQTIGAGYKELLGFERGWLAALGQDL